VFCAQTQASNRKVFLIPQKEERKRLEEKFPHKRETALTLKSVQNSDATEIRRSLPALKASKKERKEGVGNA